MLFILLTFALAASLPDIMSWEEWLDEFDHPKRFFTALRTDPERKKVFEQNIEKIKKQNALYKAGKSGYTFGVNQFADLTPDEFAKVVNLGQPMKRNSEPNFAYFNGTAPASVDWRDHGAVTPVKNQGQCGSCWSFSTTGAVEGAVYVGSKTLVSVSEKQLVDCATTRNNGCNGGLMDYAFEYIISNGGLDTEADYPYEPEQGTCNRVKEKTHAVTIKGYQDVQPNSVDDMKSALAQSTVSVAIEADKEAFQLYSGGVLDKKECGTQLDHGVLAVGYTASDNSLYPNAFIVKNSWGPTWGVQGYVYISTDTQYSRAGICGILSNPSFATGGKAVTPTPPGPTPAPGDNFYENPFQVENCKTGEYNVTLTNTQGSSYCAPDCTNGQACPSSPAGFNSVTAGCTVNAEMVNKKFCGLTCNPYGSSTCGDGSTCNVFCDSVNCQWLCSYKPFNIDLSELKAPQKKPMAVI